MKKSIFLFVAILIFQGCTNNPGSQEGNVKSENMNVNLLSLEGDSDKPHVVVIYSTLGSSRGDPSDLS